MPCHRNLSVHLFNTKWFLLDVLCIFPQFIQAIGLDKTAFHLVGISMGGHIAGVYAAVHGQTSLLQSLVLLCPAGIDAPQLSSFISNVAQGGKNYLLPETPREISVMVTKVFFKDVQLPYFMARMMNEERRPWQDLYKKSKAVNIKWGLRIHNTLRQISDP